MRHIYDLHWKIFSMLEVALVVGEGEEVEAAVARADSRRAENEAVLGEHRTCQVDWLICPFCDDVLR